MTGKKESSLREALKLIRDVALIAAFAVTFHSTAFAFYYIPSSSMEPTLEIGDRIVVSSYAFGFSHANIPYGPHLFAGRIFEDLPERGDVVVFRHPDGSGDIVIKRVIGLPGDRIAFAAGRLVINGQTLARTFEKQVQYRDARGRSVRAARYRETLPGGRSYRIFERADDYPYDNFAEVTVPDGTLFLAGDNRDVSKDSRVPGGPGFLPLENLIGRADFRSFTTYDCSDGKRDDCSGLAWDRFFTAIQE